MRSYILSGVFVVVLLGCGADPILWQYERTDLLKDDGRVLEGVKTSLFDVKNDREPVKGHVSFNKHELRYEFQDINSKGGTLVLTYPDGLTERFVLAVGETKDCFGMGQSIGVRMRINSR
jgi:hypothetical protein